ncbi:MAG: hypothetical protein ACK56F_12200 [bacterium]
MSRGKYVPSLMNDNTMSISSKAGMSTNMTFNQINHGSAAWPAAFDNESTLNNITAMMPPPSRQ